MIIKIWGTDQGDGDNGGWMYSIWKAEEVDEDDVDGDDGGLCTGSKMDALGMAMEQAEALLLMDCKHEFIRTDGTCDNCGEKPKESPMKTFNVILETSIEAETLEKAQAFADEKLSIVGHDAELYDVHECKAVENLA